MSALSHDNVECCARPPDEARRFSLLAACPAAVEIFPFVIPGQAKGNNDSVNWFNTFRWDLITTAAWSIGQNETICHAHKNNARVVQGFSMAIASSKAVYMGLLYNKTARAAWIEHTIGSINRIGADGINFVSESSARLLPAIGLGPTLR